MIIYYLLSYADIVNCMHCMLFLYFYCNIYSFILYELVIINTREILEYLCCLSTTFENSNCSDSRLFCSAEAAALVSVTLDKWWNLSHKNIFEDPEMTKTRMLQVYNKQICMSSLLHWRVTWHTFAECWSMIDHDLIQVYILTNFILFEYTGRLQFLVRGTVLVIITSSDTMELLRTDLSLLEPV